jgi:hypothetical protein
VSIKSKSQYRDVPFAILYLACIIVLYVSGISITLKTVSVLISYLLELNLLNDCSRQLDSTTLQRMRSSP